MAHPMKKDAASDHTAKLRRMTEDYGSAGPDNIPSESARLKQEGPEEAVGFGADSNAPSARRGDRSRRTSAANPVSTYQKGGAVAARAKGGRTGSKGKKGTNVNVIIAPQGGGAAAAPPPAPVLPVPPAGGPPPMMKPPMGAGPMGPGPMAGGPPPGLPMAPGAPGGMPPGIMPPRAKGGRVKHEDEAEDKALIQKTLREEGLTPARATGGKIHMTAGAASGEGRLEKIAMQEKAGHKKPQTV